MKNKTRVIVGLVCIIILIPLVALIVKGIKKNDSASTLLVNAVTTQVVPEGPVIDVVGSEWIDIEENENLSLKLANDFLSFEVIDKRSGKVWTSSMNEEFYDMSKVNNQWQKKMKSLFTISYTDIKKGFGAIVTADIFGIEHTAEAKKLEDGVLVTYDLPSIGFKIPILINLVEDGFKVSILSQGLEEYGDYSIVGIDLMPFFSAVQDQTPGYFFYPDGSGAIMNFTDHSHKNEKSKSYYVYGDIEDYEHMKGYFEESTPEVMLPVFGAKVEDSGYLAIITSGEENSKITINPSNNIIDVNYMYSQFIYRRGFDDPRVKTKSMKTYVEQREHVDFSVVYKILEEEDSDYSGMARVYRDYLVETGQLVQKDRDEAYPLSLDIFMGIIEEGMLLNKFQTVTTFEQAQSMLEGLAEEQVNDLEVQLKGWTKSGYYSEPKQFPVNKSVGGEEGLKALSNYALNNDIELYLEANFLEARGEQKGYSKRDDVIYTGNRMILTDKENTVFLLSPEVVRANYETFIEKANHYNLHGLSLYGMGKTVYYNYNTKNTVSISTCKEEWGRILEDNNNTFTSTITQGGNQYVLPYVDKVTQIAHEDIGYQFTSESVPFYQMVVHGYVDYIGQQGNLSNNLDRLKLKWIEYGYLPYFELTWESAEKLMYTEYNSLFTSKFEEWKQTVVDIYKEMEESCKAIRNATMEQHTKLDENVYSMAYSNGTVIYVNYGSQDYKQDQLVVPALGYIVSKEGE